MPSKELFFCNHPLYSVGRLGDGGTEFYVAGGGGTAKSGVPNSLDVRRLCRESGQCIAVPVHHHDMETGAIMNSATHPKRGYQLAVGVDGECLALEVTNNDESSKKESGIKQRKKSKTDDKDSSVNEGQSHIVTVKARVQTDFSSECYQKVVRFTCDGGRVVTGGSDGVVRVWKYPSLEKVCELNSHKSEIETLSCHPSKQQAVSMCRGGRAVVWDLTNHDEEYSFSWSPGQPPGNAKPTHRFRASCFSKEKDEPHTFLYTLAIPVDRSKKEKSCHLLKWDAGAWIVDEKTRTGTELVSALAIDGSGRYIGVGTIDGNIMIYSTDLKLISRVSAVHAGFVTGLLFLPLPPPEKPVTSSPLDGQVSKPEKLVLISISVDRTCSAILVQRKSGKYAFLFLFIFIPLFVLLVAMVTKHYHFW